MGMGARNNKYNITTTTTQKKWERKGNAVLQNRPTPPPCKKGKREKKYIND